MYGKLLSIFAGGDADDEASAAAASAAALSAPNVDEDVDDDTAAGVDESFSTEVDEDAIVLEDPELFVNFFDDDDENDADSLFRFSVSDGGSSGVTLEGCGGGEREEELDVDCGGGRRGLGVVLLLSLRHCFDIVEFGLRSTIPLTSGMGVEAFVVVDDEGV